MGSCAAAARRVDQNPMTRRLPPTLGLVSLFSSACGVDGPPEPTRPPSDAREARDVNPLPG